MPIGNPIQKNNDTRVISATATTGQTDFTVTGGYTINAIGVFRNGVRLNNSTDFTAADGSTVSLNVACDAGDTVTFHIFDKFTVANALVGAASTQTVFGNLTLNGELYADNFNPTNVDITGISTIAKAIIGTGVTIDQSNIDTVGIISATTFNGSFVGTITGAASQITVADESSDTTCFPTFVTAATGNLAPKSGTNLTFNSNTGQLDATILSGVVSGSTGTFSSNVEVTGELTVADMLGHKGDTHTKLSFPANDTIAFTTGGTERARIDSDGDVGIGTDNPICKLVINSGTTDLATQIVSDDANVFLAFKDGDSTGNQQVQIGGVGNNFVAYAGGNERLRIDSSGKMGLGDSTPSVTLETVGHNQVTFGSMPETIITYGTTSAYNSGSAGSGIQFGGNYNTTPEYTIFAGVHGVKENNTNAHYAGTLVFSTRAHGGNSAERVRITSAGALLIGHTAVIGHSGVDGYLQVTGTDADTASLNLNRFSADANSSVISFGKSRNASKGGNTVVQDGDYIGYINFAGNDGTDFDNPAGYIAAQVDGTPGTDDMPGRLVFATTTDGQNSATERMRITSGGQVVVGGTSSQASDAVTLMPDGEVTAAGFYFSNNIGSAMNNTGIRRATTNTMVFDTDSTERLRINATGQVRVLGGGNVSPASKGNLFVADGGTAAQTAGEGGTIAFGAWLGGDLSAPYSMAAIQGISNSSTTNVNTGSLIFSTRDQSGGPDERMRINDAGTLLLGATAATFNSPVPSIDIEKTSTTTGPLIFLYNGQSATLASTCEIRVGQNYREANRIVFGRENASNWQSSAASTASYTAFYTNNAGTIAERLRISSLGVLTTKQSNTNTTSSNWNGAIFAIQNTSDTDNNASVLQFLNSAGGADAAIQGIHEDAAGSGGSRRGHIQFGTSSAGSSGSTVERMRLTQDGNLSLGMQDTSVSYADGAGYSTAWSSTAGYNSFINVKSLHYSCLRMRGQHSVDTEFTIGVGGGSYYMAYDEIINAHRLTCAASTGVVSGNLNDTSDEKLKENITSIADGQIAKIKQLRPVNFDWKDGSLKGQSGFIAQEVKTVIPDLIDGTEYDGTFSSVGYSINTNGMVAHLTKALQEAIAKIETLETKVAALESA